MAFSNFEQNVLKSSSSSASTKKKDEETKAPSGGFSNFSKAMNLEMVPVVEKKPTEQVEGQRELDQYGLPKSTLSSQTYDAIPYEDTKKESFWTRAAKFVLPKKAEDFFGLNKSEAYKDIFESFENAYAVTDLKKLIEKVDPETGKLPKQTAGQLYNETPVDQYIPFISTIRQISEATQIYQSAKRLESGDNTPVDDLRLANFKLESERDKTFGAKVVDIITQLPAFAGELALTGGIFKVGKIATEKAATKILTTQAKKTALRNTTERILTKSLGNIAGGTLQTIPARIGEITAGTIKNMTPTYGYTSDNELKQFEAFIDQEGDDLWKAAAVSFTDQWVEVVSEHSGGIFNEVLNPIAKPVKNKLMKVAIFNSFFKKIIQA